MKLLILAGGFGTRLKSAVSDVPKALAPVGNVPFLQLQLEHWLSQGLSDFSFLLHHQADQIIDFLDTQSHDHLSACNLDWLIEPIPMDTGGAIANAVQQLNLSGDFLVINADTWLGGGIGDVMKSVSPAIAVVNRPNVSRYGKVYFDERNCVKAFWEKSNLKSSGWINAGLCLLSAEIFHGWNGQPFSLENDIFISLMNQNMLASVPLKVDFIDIGVPADYLRFCSWVQSGRTTQL